MVNEEHEPTDDEEQILTILKDGRDRNEPWGYTTPLHLRTQNVASVDYHLGQLATAGWIKRDVQGFYRFVEDPRETTEHEHEHDHDQ